MGYYMTVPVVPLFRLECIRLVSVSWHLWLRMGLTIDFILEYIVHFETSLVGTGAQNETF